MEFSDQNPAPLRLTPEQAWADFMQKYTRLSIRERKPLSRIRRRVDTARRDANGERLRPNGEPYKLGIDRIATILLAASEAMPEKFAYSHHTEEWFEVGQPPK